MGSKTYDENSSQTIKIVDRLPDLPDDAIQDASKEHNVGWVQGMFNHYDLGDLHDMPDFGITLQIVSDDTARCISVFDHGYCLFMLRMMIQTFKHAGLILEVDPHTVLRPYEVPVEREIEQRGGGARDDGNFGIEVV